jgi:succinyl-CoA synthetase beta subunit
VQVNPLAETKEGKVVVCDAKINFDDNAEFRQGPVFQFRDRTQEDPREVEAAKHDLNYIGMYHCKYPLLFIYLHICI